MFTCKNSIDLLIEFFDGSMDPDEEKALVEHLEACPPCMDFVSTYRATPGLCRRALAAKMPPELSSRLTDFLRNKTRK